MDITEQEQHQLPPRESREVELPCTQPAIEIQSIDSNCMECTESTPITYRKYIESGAIPKNMKQFTLALYLILISKKKNLRKTYKKYAR